MLLGAFVGFIIIFFYTSRLLHFSTKMYTHARGVRARGWAGVGGGGRVRARYARDEYSGSRDGVPADI